MSETIERRPAPDENVRDGRVRLNALRRHLGLTEQEIAARLGISPRSYRQWERGRRSMRGWTEFVIALSREFDVSIDWLASGAAGELPRNDRLPISMQLRPLAGVTGH